MKHMVQAVTRSLRSRDRYSYVREKFMSGRKPFPTMAQTLRSVARQPVYSFSEGDIRARLESFRDARLMVEMDGHYLSVAVWRNRAAR